MERMLALVVERPVAACAGALGMLCLAAYPLARGRSLLLTTYLGNNLGFTAHYALLGQATATTMNLTLGLQTVRIANGDRTSEIRAGAAVTVNKGVPHAWCNLSGVPL
jgi:hypothetical protein